MNASIKRITLYGVISALLSVGGDAGILDGRSRHLIVPGSLTAKFNILSTRGSKTVRSAGEVVVGKSRQFRVDFTAPSRRTLCGVMDKVLDIHHPSQSATIYDARMFADLMQIIKGAYHYRGHWYKSNYHGFHFMIQESRGKIAFLRFVDGQDFDNQVRLSGVHYGGRKSDNFFQCRVPSGYDVIYDKKEKR